MDLLYACGLPPYRTESHSVFSSTKISGLIGYTCVVYLYAEQNYMPYLICIVVGNQNLYL